MLEEPQCAQHCRRLDSPHCLPLEQQEPHLQPEVREDPELLLEVPVRLELEAPILVEVPAAAPVAAQRLLREQDQVEVREHLWPLPCA